MSPDEQASTNEDPDVIAERIIASLSFLSETAQGASLDYLRKALTQCLAACEIAFLKDKRRRFLHEGGKKGQNGK